MLIEAVLRQRFTMTIDRNPAILFMVHNIYEGSTLDLAVNVNIVRFWENPNQPYRDDTWVPTEERTGSRMTRTVSITQQS